MVSTVTARRTAVAHIGFNVITAVLGLALGFAAYAISAESNAILALDAILLGAIGHPDVKPGILEKGILLRARFELDQYINLRPVRLYPGVETPIKDKGPAEIDYVVVRENTGGVYTGTGGISLKGTPNEVAVQSMVYNRHQVERCLRWAFEYARRHGKKARGVGDENTLALVGKGICFDTGGVNVKSAKYMHGMHEDMQGSAVALGTFLALTRLEVDFPIDCWLALAENHLGPRAYKPNDVVTACNGTSIEIVHTDAEGRMRLDRLKAQVAEDRDDGCLPFLVVATAGSVSTGVVDPVRDLAGICREENLWLHADGAYGAPAAVLPEAPEDLRSLRLADSVALDPHKWLYCPLEAACVLTRDPDALKNAFAFYPQYYLLGEGKEEGTNFYQLGMQNSRGFRALKVWLALRAAGRKGYEESIRDDVRLAERLYENVTAHREFEAGSVHLSIATFRFVPNDLKGDDSTRTEDYLNKLNQALLAEIQSGGRLYVSNAVIDGRYLLRACIVNFRTTREDIDALLDEYRLEHRQAERAAHSSRGTPTSTATSVVRSKVFVT